MLTIWLLFSSFSLIKDDLIPWRADRKLTWNDFKGTPDKNSSNAALTSSNISFGWGFNGKNFTYNISCSFDKNKSWGRIKNDHILDHEQRHFDLTEVYARKLNKEMSAYRYNPKTVNKDVNGIYNKLMNELGSIQNSYDRETQHSKNEAKQKEWAAFIDKLLQELKEYADY